MEQHTENMVRVGLFSGSSATTLGWIASVDWIATIGVSVLVVSFLVNFIFKRRDDIRKQEKHVVEMALLKKNR
mgnify:CR=1 FL=1|tara:strand:+ start:183 stop:401 length:219 start_codon:yes stop_codon:yes gene_type:complete